jgi:hypothetical protein
MTRRQRIDEWVRRIAARRHWERRWKEARSSPLNTARRSAALIEIGLSVPRKPKG